MFRELWDCGLWVCVFFGRVGPTGEQKTSRLDDLFEPFSANSGPGGGGRGTRKSTKIWTSKKTQTQQTQIRQVILGNCGTILSKKKKKRDQRLDVYRGYINKKGMMSTLYKT